MQAHLSMAIAHVASSCRTDAKMVCTVSFSYTEAHACPRKYGICRCWLQIVTVVQLPHHVQKLCPQNACPSRNSAGHLLTCLEHCVAMSSAARQGHESDTILEGMDARLTQVLHDGDLALDLFHHALLPQLCPVQDLHTSVSYVTGWHGPSFFHTAN